MRRTLALLCFSAAGLSAGLRAQDVGAPRTACAVDRVSDGDTFHCADGTKVRLLGIDSPERGQGPGYGQATRGLMRYLPKQREVMLERDVRARDQYGRTLAWVWLGDTLVNEAMVRDGWAFLFTLAPNVRYVERITRAQRLARRAKAGLWSGGDVGCLPSDFRRHRCPA